MHSRPTRLCPLAVAFLVLFLSHAAAEQTRPPLAYKPVIEASNRRREAAERATQEWKHKRDDLVAKQKAVEAKITALASRLGVDREDSVTALASRIAVAKSYIKDTSREVRGVKFDRLATAAQMAEYDHKTDSLDAAKSMPLKLERQQAERVRQLVRRDPEGAKLVDAWTALEIQRIAAANEAALAQFRRDEVVRAEGNVRKAIDRVPDAKSPPESEVLRVSTSPPEDAAARQKAFARRNTPEGLRTLGQRFFSQMTLTLPGLERVRRLVQAEEYGPALEAYKRYFLYKLAPWDDDRPAAETQDEGHNGDAVRAEIVFPPPDGDSIRRAMEGVVRETIRVGGKSPLVEANLGPPGAIRWVFLDPKTLANDARGPWLLDFCRHRGNPGFTGEALLHSYALGGPKEHLQRWCEILDDWTMHWQSDVERSPLPLRDYNLLCVCRIQAAREKLKTLTQMRPGLVEDLPGATLARWLMAMNEEYLAAAVRLGRSGLYNFRIMALNSMLPTSLTMQEFHAHQWAVREGWRQVDNNFIFKTRRDGANFEFANDGHENTDQFLTFAFDALRRWRAQPEWLDPYWAEEFLDNFAANARYRVHNLKQDGWCYRLSVRDQRMRYLGARPEYKVNLLADEPEVRRRLWKVFATGRPEEPPRVDSEGMAFQGYYYLRSGWEPDDDLLYFQSIGQPILSGREENTGFSLFGHNAAFLLAPAPAVDGKTQNAHYGLVLNPGGKAPFAAYGRDAVKTGRFLADKHFDLVEGTFDGVYQYHRPSTEYDVFGSYGYERSLAKAQSQAQRAGQPFADEPIRDVRQSREIISIRGRETYIVTDLFQSTLPHRFTENYTIYTPVRMDNLAKRLELLKDLSPFRADAETRTLATCNVGLPNVQLRHISAFPVAYTVREPAARTTTDVKELLKKMNKCDRQQSEHTKAVHFSRHVAVDWQGQGAQVLVTLITPQGHSYGTTPPASAVRDLQLTASRQDCVGFTGKFADGTPIAYMASAQSAALRAGPVEATASALLVVGSASPLPSGEGQGVRGTGKRESIRTSPHPGPLPEGEGERGFVRGVALDCSRLAAAQAAVVPPMPDFTFRIDGGRVVVEGPIYRPIQPVTIEPAANVFVDRTSVTLACATPGVEIRYTLDGSRPTPQSPRYTGPIVIDRTCRLKARGFRPGVTEDVWQQDGTHATVVYSAVFRKESPTAAVAAGRAAPGLRYEYFEGPWTELMVRSLTMPAQASGVVASALDPGMRKTDGAFGVRYEGFLDVSRDGVYTFHAPREFLYPDNDCGYDLRLFLDGREWNPAVRWQGQGTWSAALARGKHSLRLVFVDLRVRPHKVELMWGFPHPDFTWKGQRPALMISGPGLPKQLIPDAMLCHDPTASGPKGGG